MTMKTISLFLCVNAESPEVNLQTKVYHHTFFKVWSCSGAACAHIFHLMGQVTLLQDMWQKSLLVLINIQNTPSDVTYRMWLLYCAELFALVWVVPGITVAWHGDATLHRTVYIGVNCLANDSGFWYGEALAAPSLGYVTTCWTELCEQGALSKHVCNLWECKSSRQSFDDVDIPWKYHTANDENKERVNTHTLLTGKWKGFDLLVSFFFL